jgi:demethylmenaquinone methyltransferase/2-methoxy-6-polyprenyl-1,4-benzoquinol methylase
MSVKATAGTSPPGAQDEQQAARWVQGMFANVAPTYDLLNRLLSFNIDRVWRKALTRELSAVLTRQDALILDLCCGTGDVLLEFQHNARATVMGADFCYPMLAQAKGKARRLGCDSPLFGADALHLPVKNETFDAVAIAFGFRNLANYEAGLAELHRVLKPCGVLAILEFSHPPGWFIKRAYGFYSRIILPSVGRIVSGSTDAYTYLPNSIRKFPTAELLRQMMSEEGFLDTRFQLLTGGIAALHIGEREND